jgi:hypothetical protein
MQAQVTGTGAGLAELANDGPSRLSSAEVMRLEDVYAAHKFVSFTFRLYWWDDALIGDVVIILFLWSLIEP